MKNLILIMCWAVSLNALAQKDLRNSNEDFEKYAFIDARQMYLDIVKDGYESVEIYQKLGDTYYFNNEYSDANKWYTKLFEYDSISVSSEYYFRYIQTLKSVGDYEKANKLLKSYNQKKGPDNFTKIYVDKENYLDLIDLQSGRYDIKNLDINTSSQEFGTSYYRDGKKVVFASAKDSASLISRRHKWSERQFLNLYEADISVDTGELTNAMEFAGSPINTKFHESNAVFTKDGNTVYYTSNNYLNGDYKTSSNDINKLKIFRATKKDEAKWGNVEELPFNSDEWSSAHPALSNDGNRLYFASDRPGSTLALDGSSSSDIWYVNLSSDGAVSEPVNLSKVNTVGREFFPFISRDGYLYFSSTGHMGLGGLDIFVTSLEKLESSDSLSIINIGEPVNGTYDDFAFIIDDESRSGYFSSNRTSGKGLDDIYSFKELKPIVCDVVIEGVVTDKESGALMPGSKVSLLDANNKEIEFVVVGADASYSFNVECETMYVLRATKDGYDPGEDNTTTPDYIATVNVPLVIGKSVDTQIEEIVVGDDLAEVFDIIIYFDFDKSYIRPDAEVELQKLLKYMQSRPTLKVAIGSHTDSRAPDKYNEALSDRRAQSTKSWLIENGISPSRLTAKGYGEYKLVNKCSNGVKCTKEEHQLNRRSEFIVINQ